MSAGEEDLHQLILLDTYGTIKCLLDLIKASRESRYKICFVHQLHCYTNNKTLLTNELQLLKEACLIKMFSCRLSSDCYAVMLMSDYCEVLNAEHARTLQETASSDPAETSFCLFNAWLQENFCFSVLKSKLLADGFTAAGVQSLLALGYLFPRRDVTTVGNLNLSADQIQSQSKGDPLAGDVGVGVDALFWISHPYVSTGESIESLFCSSSQILPVCLPVCIAVCAP